MNEGKNSKIERILITGSSGTIGTRLFEKLADDYSVVGVDKKPNKWDREVNENTIIGDLKYKKTFRALPKNIDLVVHLAANARVYNLVVNPELALENFQTLFRTLEFCRLNNIKKFIFASSREVYGNTEKTIHSEEDAFVQNCESPYTSSKIGGETLVHAYQRCYRIDSNILRFSNVYGMYDESDRVIPLFIKNCKEGKDLNIFGAKKNLDFTHIDDTINGITSVINQFENPNVKNQTFNIASGKGVSIYNVAQIIKREMKAEVNINVKRNRTGEVVRYVADITKAREVLGFNPTVDIEEGIKRSIEWYDQKNVDKEIL